MHRAKNARRNIYSPLAITFIEREAFCRIIMRSSRRPRSGRVTVTGNRSGRGPPSEAAKRERGRPNYGLWNRTGSNSRGLVRHVFLGSNLPAV